MSNAAKLAVPGAGDDGKAQVYNETNDDYDLLDLATAAELTAHTGDTSDAHDASAVSFSPTGTIAGTDVQTAVAEVATDAAAALTAHEADTSNVHGITDTSALATSSDVTSAVAAHAADTTSVHGITDTSTLLVLAAAAGTGDDGKTPVYNETNGTFDLVDALTSPIPVADGGTGAATAAAALANLGGSPSVQTINAQTGTTYTVVLTDVDKIVTQSNASAITTTLPQDSDVAFPVGTHTATSSWSATA